MGLHATFAFKFDDQVERKFHSIAYGYTYGKEDFTLREATLLPEEPDWAPRAGESSGEIVWPEEQELEEYVHDLVVEYVPVGSMGGALGP